MIPVIFVHGESELAEVTGLHEKKLREKRSRHLRQGQHWEICAQHVAYTPAGAQLVIEAVLGRELTPEELGAALDGSRLAVAKPAVPTLTAKVVKTWPNPWLLTVELPEGQPVNIRVKNSKNFRRGMECPVRLNNQGQYELARRLPRYPGRW